MFRYYDVVDSIYMLGLIHRDYWEHNFVDLFRGLATALGPKEQSKVLHIPKHGTCIPVRSGRAGLVAALKALDLPKGARIGVPLYCCPFVFKAINAADCKVPFLDIEPETFYMSPNDISEKISQLDAVIAVPGKGIGKFFEGAAGDQLVEAPEIGNDLLADASFLPVRLDNLEILPLRSVFPGKGEASQKHELHIVA